MSTDVSIPSYNDDLLWPTLRAVREIGDSGTSEEIVEKVIELESFSEEQQAIPHGDGPQSAIDYRVAWARSYLTNHHTRGVLGLASPYSPGRAGGVVTTQRYAQTPFRFSADAAVTRSMHSSAFGGGASWCAVALGVRAP